jgi:predicted ATPase
MNKNINNIKVKNFMSLKDVSLDLSLRNILVGPNMAGKSNIIRVFKFLNHISLSGLTAAITGNGGFSEILWKGVDEGKISFILDCEVFINENEKPRKFCYELSFTGSAITNSFIIEREKLISYINEKEYILANFVSGRGEAFHQDGSIAFEQKEQSNQSFLEYSVPGWEGTIFKHFISRWRFYHLIPFRMRQVNPISEQYFLNESGDNLASWLLTLQTRYRDDYRLIEQVVQDTMPEIMGVLTPPTQVGTTFVQISERHLKRPVYFWGISDGALCFIALLSLIFTPEILGAPLICVEEPENHLHPKLIETLAEILRQRQIELAPRLAQIIVTTHYPYLIDMFSLEDLIAIQKKEGVTYCSRLSERMEFMELLEKSSLTPSDIWYSGTLEEE